MKREARQKFDLLPVLGIVGLLFVILYFLLANIRVESGEQPQRQSSYYLFYKLYKNLGYQIKDYAFETIPRQRNDMAICFDYDLKRSVFRKEMHQWIDRGGTLWIAGVSGDRDPLGSSRVRTAEIRTIYLKNQSFGQQAQKDKLILKLNGKNIRYFTDSEVGKKARIILYSDRGPLLYRVSKGSGSIIVLSDSVLLNNDHLRNDNLAILFNQLMGPSFTKRIYILHQEVSNRQEAVPILALLFKGKLLYLTLQLLFIVMMFIVWQGKRLGEPQWVDPFARRTLSEHLKAVGQFYQKTNALRIVDEINGDYFKYKLYKKTGVQIREAGRPEEIEKIQRYLATTHGEISHEQLMLALKNDPNLTVTRLQHKERLREGILKSLRK